MTPFNGLCYISLQNSYDNIFSIKYLDDYTFWYSFAKVERPYRCSIEERNAIRAQVLADLMMDRGLFEEDIDINKLSIKDIIKYNSR